ncbi:MAG: hypothetical protein NTZ21_00665 [Actinobacteria bacterium]|nr:hypothetical protein [Actinomycetota bacterium]
MLDVHAHARQRMTDRHQVDDGTVDRDPSSQLQASGRRHRLRQHQRVAVLLATGLDSLVGTLAGAHREAGALEAIGDVGPIRRPLDPVVTSTCALIAEHGEVDGLPPTTVLRSVMRELRMKELVLHQALRRRRRVE